MKADCRKCAYGGNFPCWLRRTPPDGSECSDFDPTAALYDEDDALSEDDGLDYSLSRLPESELGGW